MIWWILIVASLFLLVIVWVAIEYNWFRRMENAIVSTKNQITVSLKKRLDMISQLIDASKSYMKFEESTLKEITEMRSNLGSKDVDLGKVYKESGALLGKIFAVAEKYPELKSSELVERVQKNVSDIEDEISRLRYLYNDQVQMFNTKCDVIPSNIVAGIFRFKKREYLKFGEKTKEVPKW